MLINGEVQSRLNWSTKLQPNGKDDMHNKLLSTEWQSSSYYDKRRNDVQFPLLHSASKVTTVWRYRNSIIIIIIIK